MSFTTNTISYYVNDSFIGDCHLRCEDLHIPRSLAYVCTTCGSLWGRVVVNNGDFWEAFSRPCEEHTSRSLADNSAAPGSLLAPGRTQRFSASMWWSGVIEFMPRPVLEREFLLAMKLWEKRDVLADA